MRNIYLLAIILFFVAGCGGGGDGGSGDPDPTNENTSTGVITEANLTPLVESFYTAFFGMQELQIYTTFNYMFEFVSSAPSEESTQACLESGTFTQTLDGTGNLTNASFDNCGSPISSPINGSYSHDLIEINSQFGPGDTLFPTDITKWHAQFDFSSLTRVDTATGSNISADGIFEFDYEDVPIGNFIGWRMTVTTDNLSYSNSTGSVFMRDLLIDYTYIESTDRLSTNISGYIAHKNVGPIAVDASLLRIEGFQSDTPRLIGQIVLTSTYSKLTITFTDFDDYTFELDGDGDGVIDIVGDSNEPPGSNSSFEGIWSSVQESGNGGLDGTFEFLGNEIYIVDNADIDFIAGTFNDTSNDMQSRLDVVITGSIAPEYIGLTMLCSYELDGSGLTMRIGCNEPGVTTYPTELIPGPDIIIWGLTFTG